MSQRRRRQSSERPSKPNEPKVEAQLSHIRPVPVTQRHELQIHAHAGPLPDPGTLEKYRAVQEDLPERIMCMAEEQARRRHKSEAVATWTEAIQRVGSMLIGGTMSLGLAGVGARLLLDGGSDATAFALIAGALAPSSRGT